SPSLTLRSQCFVPRQFVRRPRLTEKRGKADARATPRGTRASPRSTRASPRGNRACQTEWSCPVLRPPGVGWVLAAVGVWIAARIGDGLLFCVLAHPGRAPQRAAFRRVFNDR